MTVSFLWNCMRVCLWKLKHLGFKQKPVIQNSGLKSQEFGEILKTEKKLGLEEVLI